MTQIRSVTGIYFVLARVMTRDIVADVVLADHGRKFFTNIEPDSNKRDSQKSSFAVNPVFAVNWLKLSFSCYRCLFSVINSKRAS